LQCRAAKYSEFFTFLKTPAFAGVFYFMDLMAALVAALLIID